MRHLHIAHRRIAHGKDAKKYRQDARDERALLANEAMREYEEAYAALYNITIELTYKNGWVHSEHEKPMRLIDAVRKAKQMWATVHATELNGVSDE